jgi:hypothetical protein
MKTISIPSALILAAAAAGAAEIPVRHVILYKHGVGYFERSGELGPGESARLDFAAGEMNDVLKSLTLSIEGGQVNGLRYDSAEPLAKKLGEMPIRLGERQPLSALLDQVKGARIELKFGAETAAGSIVGARQIPAGQNQGEREQVTLLTDAGDIRNLDLSAATSVRFTDSKLQAQLREYLAAVTQARSADKRSVYLDSADSGRRNVTASYMLPAPVWKSSYRLIFGAQGAQTEPLLEGWAIVDNTTADDWNNVRLALVSGRPVSFVSNLYEPKYIQRPVADLDDVAAARPQVFEGALTDELRDNRAAAAAEAPAAPAVVGRVRQMAKPAANLLAAREEDKGERPGRPSTISAAAAARELGELFEYSFGKPVTVRAGGSAMLPFLQQKIGARKLLIYSDHSTQHPMNAAEITNATGKTLDGGPITVFDANAYAGEALMETLKTGDKRLISYGVDLGTRITANFDSERDNIREVKMNRGVLVARAVLREKKNFTIKNVDAKAKTLVIELPVRDGFKLVEPVKPAETTANHYRFEVKLAASAAAEFPVVEENLYYQNYTAASLTPDFLVTVIENKNISAAAKQQLQTVLERKRKIAAAEGAIKRLERSIQELFQDQNRLRENINSLNRVAGQQEQVQKYAAQLAAQEGRLAQLRDQLSAEQRSRVALESELASLIEKMEF